VLPRAPALHQADVTGVSFLGSAGLCRGCLRSIARRWLSLTAEITELDTHLLRLVRDARPGLRDIHGVGDQTAA
jgi:hypothetical protein